MPCGTSSVLSTTPATTSLASQARRYDRTARRTGNDPSTLTPGRNPTHRHPLLSGASRHHPQWVMPPAGAKAHHLEASGLISGRGGTVRIVVALGGNALLRRGDPLTTEAQRKNVRVAAEAIAPLAARHDIVVV